MFTLFRSLSSFVRWWLAGLAGGWWWFGVFFLLLLAVLVVLVLLWAFFGVWQMVAWPVAALAARLGLPRLACAVMWVLPAAPGPGHCPCGATVTPPDVCVVCGLHHPARRSLGG